MECTIYQTVRRSGVSHHFIKQMMSKILSKMKSKGNVSVHLIGDTKMKSLNKQYRGKDSTTDVLSFAMHDGMDMMMGDELGDIFISIPRIHIQARDHNISFKEEFVRMLVHGILHLLGYDHMKKKEAEKMFRLQEKLVFDIIK
jgi:probable rRNA maturation factor